jgi:hypothetical protein
MNVHPLKRNDAGFGVAAGVVVCWALFVGRLGSGGLARPVAFPLLFLAPETPNECA